MTRKTIFAAMAAAALFSAGCQNVMVTLGMREAPPPVTDSAYFNAQMDALIKRLKENQLRSFRRAAALEFVNPDGRVSELGRYLTEKFAERAVATGGFKTAPQGQVRDALAKLNIAYKGELTKEQVAKIGEALDADAVITGSVADLQKGSDVDLTVKVIQAATGEIVSAASVDIYRSKQVQTLVSQF